MGKSCVSEPSYRLGILLLAAGASRRFAGIKQLAPLDKVSSEGEKMLQLALQKVSELPATGQIVALGANKETIMSGVSLPENVSAHFVDDWQEGIAASIRSGTRALQDSLANLSHILIVLADQPALTVNDYNQLIAVSRNNLQNIICARYGQKNAVPAIFPASWFTLLQQLKGDKGAGKALNSVELSKDIISVEMLRGEEDIDTYSDLMRYQKQQWHSQIKH